MNTTVAVGYDRTTAGERALAFAAREAARRAAVLVLITAYHWLTSPEPGALTPADTEATARKAAEETAQYGTGRVRARHPDLPVEPRAVSGYAGKVLAAASHEADVLVVGDRGSGGFQGMLLGSTALRTLAEACYPVVVVRGEAADTHHRIVAAVDVDDSDEDCDAVLDFAFDEASRRGAGLTVTHVWDEPLTTAYGQQDPGMADDVARMERDREDRLAALVQSAQARQPDVHPFHQLAVGSAAGLLIEDSRRADLLVTGARRRGGGRHGMLVGPVTHTVLQHAECPVAVVPLG